MIHLAFEAMRGWQLSTSARAVTYPLLTVGMLTAVNDAAVDNGVYPVPYLSLYVAVVALLANRVCVRAGLLGAALSALSYDYWFSGGDHYGFVTPSINEAMAYVVMFGLAVAIAPRNPPADPPDRQSFGAGSELPFTTKDTNDLEKSLHGVGVRYWSVEASGDWIEDCAVGSEYARIFIERVKARQSRPLMAWIVRDMVTAGRWTGVECGFIQGVARASAAAIMNLEQSRRRSRA